MTISITGKKFLVIGAARSGQAVVRFLLEKGAFVFLNDLKSEKELALDSCWFLLGARLQFIWEKHPSLVEIEPDYIIVSPGVPFDIPPLVEAEQKGIPVWSEIELLSRFARAKLLAVTGTNGKTTTTSLLGKILADSGAKVYVGGNIGAPLIDQIGRIEHDAFIVLEVSSFQLATTEKFGPHVAVCLNLTPDHLDRHGSFAAYREAKEKIFRGQTENDYLILNADDEETSKMAPQARGKVLLFSTKHILKEGLFVRDGCLVVQNGAETRPLLPIAELQIKGGHNLENALAAAAVAWVMGVPPGNIAASLRTFRGVEHRLEPVATIKGVAYINDSKGTNPESTIRALEAYAQPLILIAGGKSKGSDFSFLAQKIKEKVRELVLVGETAEEIAQAMQKVGFANFHRVATYKEAVNKAAHLAREGEIVLLSPACASFDLFTDFEQRGRVFKELVHCLARKND